MKYFCSVLTSSVTVRSRGGFWSVLVLATIILLTKQFAGKSKSFVGLFGFQSRTTLNQNCVMSVIFTKQPYISTPP